MNEIVFGIRNTGENVTNLSADYNHSSEILKVEKETGVCLKFEKLFSASAYQNMVCHSIFNNLVEFYRNVEE